MENKMRKGNVFLCDTLSSFGKIQYDVIANQKRAETSGCICNYIAKYLLATGQILNSFPYIVRIIIYK